MKSTIYTVKSNGNVSELTDFEKSVYACIAEKKFSIGDSISEKSLKKDFAKWNDENMTVPLSTVLTERNMVRIARHHAFLVKSGSVDCGFIFKVRENKAHGNYSVDVLSADTLNSEFREKELAKREKKAVDPTEFIINYINKHSEELALADIQKAIDLLK